MVTTLDSPHSCSRHVRVHVVPGEDQEEERGREDEGAGWWWAEGQ